MAKQELLKAYRLIHTLDKYWSNEKKPACLDVALKKFKEDMRRELGKEYLGFVMTLVRHLRFVEGEGAYGRAVEVSVLLCFG